MGGKRVLSSICRDNDIVLAYLFGSRSETGLKIIEGQSVPLDDPLADLDLGIVFRDALPPPAERPGLYAKLYNLLSDLFLPFPLDLVFLQEQHSVFQSNAISGICIYAVDGSLKGDYEENTMRKAADFKPFLERYLDESLEGTLS